MKLGPLLDDHIIPIRPGKKLGIVARPGHGKSTFGGYLVKQEARRIMEEGLEDKFYAAHVSWEQPVEELEAMYQETKDYGVTDVAWGRVPLDRVIKDSIRRPSLPVWLFGESLFKSTFDTPPMTIETIYESIQAIHKEWGMLPRILFLDFIQNVPVPSERDRYTQVSSAMRLISRLAIQAHTPVVIGIQANARTDDYRTPIPGMRDTEWSAVIGQLCDTLLAIWRPIKSYLPNQEPYISVGGTEYPNSDELIVLKLLKQRMEKGHGIWGLRFDPDKLSLSEYKTVDLTQF